MRANKVTFERGASTNVWVAHALLWPRRSADEFATMHGETPWVMRRPRNADAGVSDNIDIASFPLRKAMSTVQAEIKLVMPTGNIERLRQLAGTGT